MADEEMEIVEQMVQDLHVSNSEEVEESEKAASEKMEVAEQEQVVAQNRSKGPAEAANPKAKYEVPIPDIPLYGMSKLMNLKRFCYLGSFVPVYIHLRGYVNVKKFWPIVNWLIKDKDIDVEDFLKFIRDVLNDDTLVRRDESIFVYAAYLASSVKDEDKTVMRIPFYVFIQTDDDLFLFCKYTSLISREQKRKCFSRTIRKAIKDWYERKPDEEIRLMWVARRGLHGFTHKTLIKMCRITDNMIGSSKLVRPFFRTCTDLLKEADEQSAEFPTTSGGAKKSLESPIPNSIVEAVARLRTTNNQQEAFNIIQKFNLPFKHVPGHFLRYRNIMEAVLPTMTFSEILKYWRKMIHYNHFQSGPKPFEICRNQLGNIEFARKHRIHPVHLLLRLHGISRKPLYRIHQKKLKHMHLDYIDTLYKQSFNWPLESSNLRMFITVNMQTGYKKKFLKNHKRVTFADATFALAYGYYKREPLVDIYNFVEKKIQLEKISLTKSCTTEMAAKTFNSIQKNKSSQRLATTIQYALGISPVYDVFLCIVPRAGRSNPKKKSELIANYLQNYREQKNPNARFIILNLLKIKPRSMQYSCTRQEHILEICGLDEHTTDLIHNFATGKFD